MATKPFAPKDAETLKAEVLTELGIEYEGNEEVVDKIVARDLKDEEVKASLHEQKEKRGEKLTVYEKRLRDAGFDPETGEKLKSNDAPKDEKKDEVIFTPKDYLALTENKVGSEDFDEVMRISKLLGKPVAETLKDKTAQLILQAHREERATAEATATGTSRQRTSTTVGEKVVKDFESGKLPETVEEEKALADAQFKQLLKGTK